MTKYKVENILSEEREIVLPECRFARARCWECIYFETDRPDSKGQCRCSYRGRWYFPYEGCGNGMTQEERMRRGR